MSTPTTLRTETADGVRSIVLCRPAEYNTITPAVRDELAAAIDAADADPAVHVILLRAEGPAFCAGYGLDWSTAAQATEEDATACGTRSRPPHELLVDTYRKLWNAATRRSPRSRLGIGGGPTWSCAPTS